MALTQFQGGSKEFTMMQSQWAGQLNPLLAEPLLNGQHIKNVALAVGETAIAHGLGRAIQGWILTRVRAAANIYEPSTVVNRPDLEFILATTATVTVDLYVY